MTGPEAARAAVRYCGSYDRLPRLIELWGNLEVERDDWLRVLGEEWSVCDNVGAWLDDLWDTPFADLFDGSPADRAEARALVMDDSDRAAFEALPDQFEVWRGCYAPNKWGVSWSLDRDTAIRFPGLHRYRQEGQALLVRARARKDEVGFVKVGRDEAEIVLHRPRHISTTHLRWEAA